MASAPFHDGSDSLDAPVSYCRWTSQELRAGPSAAEPSDIPRERLERFDFVELMTAISTLYSQDEVLEMQGRANTKTPLGRGGVSEVSTIFAAVTRPSAVLAHSVRRREYTVVIKQAESKLFLPNGRHNDERALRAFITEIRVLSHEYIRQHPNIVTMIGIHWDYLEKSYPEPLILMEKADLDLDDFLESHPSLPFDTKKSIALDIARGLAALHACGVIHGDLKPANILILLFDAKPRAKIADFSHSILDTGKVCRLVGGTEAYAAPEWKQQAPTSKLRKTDLYSYGLVFGSLMLGSDIVDHILDSLVDDNDMSAVENLSTIKAERDLSELVFSIMKEVDERGPNLHFNNLQLIRRVLDSTLRLDPTERDLEEVLRLLVGEHIRARCAELAPGIPKVFDSLASGVVSVPYTALQNVSPVIMDQVVRALNQVADSHSDPRRAAALVELAICHVSDFAKSSASEYNSTASASEYNSTASAASNKTAVEHLLAAADLGDDRARSTIFRVSQALGVPIADNERHPVSKWLMTAAVNGSRVALESLAEIAPNLHSEALLAYQRMFLYPDMSPHDWELWQAKVLALCTVESPGKTIDAMDNTLLHFVASYGTTAGLRSLMKRPSDDLVDFDCQNARGDTPVICAARAGNFEVLSWLLTEAEADASITNRMGENGLHFLASFTDLQVRDATSLLVKAGAAIDAEATGSSCGHWYLDTRPVGTSSCPRLRAVLSNKPEALAALLDIENNSSRNQRNDSDFRVSVSTPASTQRMLLGWACRLHHVRILELLREHFGHCSAFIDMAEMRLWTNGQLYTVLEMCILGCSSSNKASGVDLPERILRILEHGRNYQQALGASITFLIETCPDLKYESSTGARNSLFFAIKEGRREAAAVLCRDSTGLVAYPGGGRYADDPELPREILRIDKEKILEQRRRIDPRRRQRDDDWRRIQFSDTQARPRRSCSLSHDCEPVWSSCLFNVAGDDGRCELGYFSWESVDSYRGGARSKRADGRQYTVRTFGLPPNPPPPCESPLRLRWSDPVWLRRIHFPRWSRYLRRRAAAAVLRWIGEAPSATFSLPESDGPPTVTPGIAGERPTPTNYVQMGVMVDLVLAAVLHGQRGIFYDLVTGPCLDTVLKPKPCPCYICVPSCRRAMAVDADISHCFPTSLFKVSTKRHAHVIVPFVLVGSSYIYPSRFNGVLQWPLLYMSTIARSVHRDMHFAEILISVLDTVGTPQPKGWTAAHWYEDLCLSSDKASGQTTALFHAASLQWHELSSLLMKNGAGPQTQCYYPVIETGEIKDTTVLARVLAATQNANGEVNSLLQIAADLSLPNIVRMADVDAILTFSSSPDGPPHWAWGRDGEPGHVTWFYDPIRIRNFRPRDEQQTIYRREPPQIIGRRPSSDSELSDFLSRYPAPLTDDQAPTDGPLSFPPDHPLRAVTRRRMWLRSTRVLLWDQRYRWWPKHNALLWRAIVAANAAQALNIQKLDYSRTSLRRLRGSTLVRRAAEMRNLEALQAMLDMGFDPNSCAGGVNALDVASWTRLVPDGSCGADALRLKNMDAEISAALRARGAERG